MDVRHARAVDGGEEQPPGGAEEGVEGLHQHGGGAAILLRVEEQWRAEEHFGLLGVGGAGLLEQDVLARGQGLERPLEVQPVGRGDVDCIDFWVVQDCLEEESAWDLKQVDGTDEDIWCTLVAVPDLRDAVGLGVGDSPCLVPGGNGVDNHLWMALGRGDEANICNVGCAQDAKLEGVILLGGHGWPEHEPVAAQST